MGHLKFLKDRIAANFIESVGDSNYMHVVNTSIVSDSLEYSFHKPVVISTASNVCSISPSLSLSILVNQAK